jgi:O-antigen ligase
MIRLEQHKCLNGIQMMALSLLVSTIAVVPLIYSTGVAFPYSSPKLLSMQVLVAVIGCCALLKASLSESVLLRVNLLDLAVIAWLMYIVALLSAGKGNPSHLHGVELLFTLTMWYVVFQCILHVQNDARKFLLAVVSTLFVVCLVEAAISIVQFIEEIIHPIYSETYQKPPIRGTIGNPNKVAGFLSACVPFLLLFSKLLGSKRVRLVSSIGIAIVLCTIGLTLSRGAWIALTVGMTFMYLPALKPLFTRMTKRASTILSLFTILALCSSLAIYTLFNINRGSVFGRLFALQVTADMIKSNPILGVGYGNFAVNYLEYQGSFLQKPENERFASYASDPQHANNEYLQVLAETGIVGGIFFSFILLACFATGNTVLKRSEENLERKVARVALSSTLIILVHSLFDSPLQVIPTLLLFYMNLALLCAITKLQRSNEALLVSTKFQLKMSPIIRAAIIGAAIFVSVLVCLRAARQFDAFEHWQNGISSAMISNWQDAIAHYETAYRVFPDDGRLLVNMGAAYLNDSNPTRAVELLQTTKQTYQDRHLFRYLSFAYAESSQPEKAVQILNEFRIKFPNLLLPHLLMAKHYFDNGKYGDAINHANIVLAKAPKIENAYAHELRNEARTLLGLIHTKQ